MDDAAFESFTLQCQEIVVSDGRLHISALPGITQAAMPKMGLREGWAQTLKSLTLKNIPTFIFSSGYGDVVMQAMLHGGVEQQQAAAQYQQTMPASLPLNMRIISNFCRTGPDGTVRAFSSQSFMKRIKMLKRPLQSWGFLSPNAVTYCFLVVMKMTQV